MPNVPGTHPKRGTRRKPLSYTPLTWITNRSIARQLKELDCSVVAIFADIARDPAVTTSVRFRAAKLLALLLFGPRLDQPVSQEQLDLSAIIAREGGEMTRLDSPAATLPDADAQA